MIVEGRFSATTHTTHTLRGRSIRFDLVGLWLARGRRRPQRDQTSGTISASAGARIRPPGAPVDRHHPEPVPEPFSGAKSDRFYATIRATSTRVSTTAPQKLAILKIFPSIDSLSCSLALRWLLFRTFSNQPAPKSCYGGICCASRSVVGESGKASKTSRWRMVE